ncbi:MAG: nucleotidyltransferase domain-containing protein [Clostridia bacterium]|nr:nucleotidyltransferase domain-containing protein [Clostridia bacterium]
MKEMPENINRSINELLKIINELFKDRAKKVILYGSYARGDYNNSSDIDVMILTDLTDEEIVEYRDKLWDLVYDIELNNNVILSPLVKNIDKFNYWLEVLPFYMNVQNEGVILK